MRDIAAFLLINAAFIAANAIGAGIIWLLGSAAMEYLPWAAQYRLLWVVIGLAGIAASVYFLALIMGHRPFRGRGRGRA